MYAVIESIAKLTAAGADWRHCWLSFQEYSEKLGRTLTAGASPLPLCWGALRAQLELGAEGHRRQGQHVPRHAGQ